MKSLVDISVEEWDRIFAVNLRSVFLCYKEAAKIMIEQGQGGRLIAACSTAGHRSFENLGHYCTTKWAVRGLTQAAALEWASHKITVTSYCPGIDDLKRKHLFSKQILLGRTQTSIADSCAKALAKQEGKTEEEVMKGFLSTIPRGRLGTPDEITSLASFLASEQVDYITGQNIMMNGGQVLC